MSFAEALNPSMLMSTINALINAVPRLGSDIDERRLRDAAGAHLRLAAQLNKLHDEIDPYVATVVKEWKGPAADAFRDQWEKIASQKVRADLQQSCVGTSGSPGTAQCLNAVADGTHMTKRAVVELTKLALEWVSFHYIAKFAFAGLAGAAVATVALVQAAQIAGKAVKLIKILEATLRMISRVLRALPLLRRLKLAKGATKVNLIRPGTSLLAAARSGFARGFSTKLAGAPGFANYAKTSAYVYGGILATQGAAQAASGESFFNLDPAALVKAGRITTLATGIAKHGFGGQAVRGAQQGASGASYAASFDKTGLAVAESGASFGGMVATRNPLVTKIMESARWKGWFDPTSGKYAGVTGAWWGNAEMQRQALGFLPTSGFRILRPLTEPAPPPDLPAWQQPERGTYDPSKHAAAPAMAGGGSHTVARGETLAEIAYRVYGDASMAQVIEDANRDIMRGQDRVLPGQRLILPELPRF